MNHLGIIVIVGIGAAVSVFQPELAPVFIPLTIAAVGAFEVLK